MVNLFLLIIFTVISLKQPILTITVRKFVYQKDMSEYCKRRVVPSVFLGRHVMEAHSKILHFSRTELPYNCFISVRAESGSNIVLVVQLLSDKSLVKACSESPSQLLVYEMGETFGGYWGPLPDSAVHPGPTQPEVYTRKTTQPEVTQTKSTDYYTTEVPTTTQKSLHKLKQERVKQDFIRIEVPIVNVSGRLVDERDQLQSGIDIDDIFDLLYDVTPRAKQQYETSILPLVQFAVSKQNGGRRGDDFRYNLELDYESDRNYTTDVRLPFRHYSERSTRRKDYRTNFYVNRLINFKKIRTTYRLTKQTPQYFRKNFQASSTNLDPVLHNTLTDTKSHKSPISSSIQNFKSREDNVLGNMNQSFSDLPKYNNEDKNITRLLDTISNMKYNRSLYLLRNWNSFLDQHNNQSLTKRFDEFSTRNPLASSNHASISIQQLQTHTKSLIQKALSVSTSKSEMKYSSEDKVSKTTKNYKITLSESNKSFILTTAAQTAASTPSVLHETITVNKTTPSINVGTISTNAPRPLPAPEGSMVDHESWENVVQAAPVMAKLLNQSVLDKLVTYASQDSRISDTVPNDKSRIKRKIQPIPIDNARPHNLTTEVVVATTTASSYGISEMQEFAQLVELQDDELHERVALRYLRQYTGPLLFNICDYGEPNARHVYLFNSSRVVLAFQNFTLERMSVMLTPARTLLSGAARCSATSLECQVYGTRICIDIMNACDGVPNCGAYDIYDEDRLMCGAAAGLQHNVYLAAITFMAVLLTLIYTVHYWLKRCVPKVSEAFFIYTDGAENILYLESIMRSPHDIDEGPKAAYHAHLFDDDDYINLEKAGKHQRNIFLRIIRACLIFCMFKRREKRVDDEPSLVPVGSRKIYSFAELELSKMVNQEKFTDAAVQTGNSIEMSGIELRKSSLQPKSLPERLLEHRRMATVAATSDDDQYNHINELNMLKFFKDFKSDHAESASRAIVLSETNEVSEASDTVEPLVDKSSFEEEEEELQSLYYDQSAHETSHRVITTTCDIHSEKPTTSKQTKKHLRFEKEAITIPSAPEEDDEDYEESKNITLDRKNKDHDADGIGGGRDFKRFWKGKKSKKKTHLALR